MKVYQLSHKGASLMTPEQCNLTAGNGLEWCFRHGVGDNPHATEVIIPVKIAHPPIGGWEEAEFTLHEGQPKRTGGARLWKEVFELRPAGQSAGAGECIAMLSLGSENGPAAQIADLEGARIIAKGSEWVKGALVECPVVHCGLGAAIILDKGLSRIMMRWDGRAWDVRDGESMPFVPMGMGVSGSLIEAMA